MSASDSEDAKPIVFNRRKPRNLRKRIKSEDESDDSDLETHILPKLEETREMQRLRERPNGVSAIGLAIGEKISLADELTAKDPYKIKTGGLVNMKAMKSGTIKQVDDAYDTGIGTQFSAETNKRDEDDEMMKYIDEQLQKRKGELSSSDKNDSKYLSPEEAALMSLPENLRGSGTAKSEEMLSNQMLSGIPEVDLGIEAKIKNIEATEEAKLKLLWEQRNKKDAPSQFVPTNVAVNFVQHNRFNLDEARRKRPTPAPPVEKVEPVEKAREVNIEESVEKIVKKAKGERATDDYHYEKFRKQFRKH